MLAHRKKLKSFMTANVAKRFSLLEYLSNLSLVENLRSPIGGFLVWPVFLAILTLAAFYDIKTVTHQAVSPVSAQVAELHHLKITGRTTGDCVTGLVLHKHSALH